MLAATKRRSLWTALAELYGHRWTSSYGDNPDEGAALTWAKVLADMTPQQLADGLTACAKSADPWPPTLPEFRAMCLSIPSLHAVRCELLAGQKPAGSVTSPFARLVWQHLDSHRWRMADADRADRLLREAYEAARSHVMAGGKLPEPLQAIAQEPAPKPKPSDPETAKAHLAKLSALLGPNIEAGLQ